jgi:predicted methyltransferase
MLHDPHSSACRARRACSLLLLGLALSCASEVPPPQPPPPPPPAPTIPPPEPPTKDVQLAVLEAVAAEDRSEDDIALDPGRQPQRLFTFLGVAPGMRVAELAAGGGYSAEILARVVGPDGKVYGQNSKFILERFAEAPWSKRLLKPVMGNVVRLDSEFGAPFTSEVKDLDLVVMILFYHDTVWMKTDRDAMNRAVFAALKSGGRNT